MDASKGPWESLLLLLLRLANDLAAIECRSLPVSCVIVNRVSSPWSLRCEKHSYIWQLARHIRHQNGNSDMGDALAPNYVPYRLLNNMRRQ